MIALIVCGMIIIVSIILIIIFIKTQLESFLVIPFWSICICAILLPLSLCGGATPFDSNKMMMRKNDLLLAYNTCPCTYHLSEIESYNREVNKYNDLWCKFKVEDRSEYLIDLDWLLQSK